jgi:hypothetical protein
MAIGKKEGEFTLLFPTYPIVGASATGRILANTIPME